jgi:hypothetical protein
MQKFMIIVMYSPIPALGGCKGGECRYSTRFIFQYTAEQKVEQRIPFIKEVWYEKNYTFINLHSRDCSNHRG